MDRLSVVERRRAKFGHLTPQPQPAPITGANRSIKDIVKKEIDSYFNAGGGVKQINNIVEFWINAVVSTAHSFTAHILFPALAALVRVCIACTPGARYKRLRRKVVFHRWNMHVGVKESNKSGIIGGESDVFTMSRSFQFCLRHWSWRKSNAAMG